MAASMPIPAFAAAALVVAGVITGGSAMVIEHLVTLAGRLVAMLLRRDEYSGGDAHGAAPQAIADNRDTALIPHKRAPVTRAPFA